MARHCFFIKATRSPNTVKELRKVGTAARPLSVLDAQRLFMSQAKTSLFMKMEFTIMHLKSTIKILMELIQNVSVNPFIQCNLNKLFLTSAFKFIL